MCWDLEAKLPVGLNIYALRPNSPKIIRSGMGSLNVVICFEHRASFSSLE
ncbi:hypothetical protein M378DRAFT_170380 [Amanita muscaria Koide BX008]|uniref:Uncharacterized protein n=1 Tax=Amanita muscaria (strain Koide BX008) TaxID=946122 RepID=A0A0C2WPJ1_AMAMK|nr:hypothetical protein M378DRAFT_170380 [Amanita muscaria Koide BX008]